jgi:hypothetical protein
MDGCEGEMSWEELSMIPTDSLRVCLITTDRFLHHTRPVSTFLFTASLEVEPHWQAVDR